MKNSNFIIGMILMVAVTGAALAGYDLLYRNQAPYLNMAAGMLRSGEALCIDSELSSRKLSGFLERKGYGGDRDDADAIATFILGKVREKRNGSLENLGELNTRAFRLPAPFIDSKGGETLRRRVEESRQEMGLTSYPEDCKRTPAEGKFAESAEARCIIKVKVKSDENLPTAGVPVRLRRHYYATSKDNAMRVAANDSTLAYVTTDAEGVAEFRVRPGSYSVVPVEEGYEFGTAKGSTRGELGEKTYKYTFEKRRHSIPAFSRDTFREIKGSDALLARTPASYGRTLKTCVYVLTGMWWMAFIVIGVFSRRREDRRDMIIIPVVMLLNMTSLLVLFGIGNPLNDRLLGEEMTYASGLGIVAMTLLSMVPVSKIYSGGITVLRRRIPFEPTGCRVKGLSYLLCSIGLLVALAFFGSAPEGSEAKINLFVVQPSEICKFLTVIFIAAFFAENTDAVRKFSERTNKVSLRLRVRTVSIIFAAILLLSLIYMVVLSDMGPALVILITFIMMYSFARKDFMQLVAGVVSYAGCFLIADRLMPRAEAAGVAAGVWLILWIGISMAWKRRIYESAIFFNLLIVLFMTGGKLLSLATLDGQASRLDSRLSMCGSGVWDNDLPEGGDQIAQAIWGYSTGGPFGQGLGLGNSSLIPAGPTDMFLASAGEQLGLAGLTVILACMIAILYRLYADGRNSGHPFSFYLATGIGSVTLVQFLIIALGSVGAIPLTGIAVPFLSYAKSSIVCNLAAIGIVIAISREKAGHYQRISMADNSRTLVCGFLSYATLCCALFYCLADSMVINRDEAMLHTGIFSNATGHRSFHYNPRIGVLEDKLSTGAIYDCNGLLLATSKAEQVLEEVKKLTEAGLSARDVVESVEKPMRRYYPFGMQTFFMVGDYNTKLLWNSSSSNPYGFNAENAYLSKLRGFDNVSTDDNGERVLTDINLRRYKPDRFLPAISTDTNRREMKYDYRELLPLLKKGVAGHRELKMYANNKAADVWLTLDARLQVMLQNRMRDYIGAHEKLAALKKLRASVVVLDCGNGDLLCSANYPLPERGKLDSLQRNAANVYNEKDAASPAYTDRDLGLTYQTHPGSTAKIMTAMAGYRKLGDKVKNATYAIDLNEIIENGRVREPYSTAGGRRLRCDVTVTEAIVASSNCYFVNLLADKNLYGDLGEIYKAAGVRLENGAEKTEEVMKRLAGDSEKNYGRYREAKRSGKWRKMNRFHGSADYWGIAYGQGELYASPLNMAKIAGIVAADGELATTRFARSEPVRRQTIVPTGTKMLQQDMKLEADKHRNKGIRLPESNAGVTVMSKTGTPERAWIYTGEDGKRVEEKPNEGWYIFAVKDGRTGRALSVAVRLERLGNMGSRMAVEFAADVIIPALRDCGYAI